MLDWVNDHAPELLVAFMVVLLVVLVIIAINGDPDTSCKHPITTWVLTNNSMIPVVSCG